MGTDLPELESSTEEKLEDHLRDSGPDYSSERTIDGYLVELDPFTQAVKFSKGSWEKIYSSWSELYEDLDQ
ncbi:MAG: hypothetical protein ABEJ66_01600 [Candidatus Nanohaloarchaea archaeon]